MIENNKILGRPIEILLVEDNYSDVVLVKEAFKEGHTATNLSVVDDGEKALNYLRKKDKFSNVVTPDLILLDLNLPKINGIEILKIIKSDEDLRIIPVIMLSTSQNKEDIKSAYKNYANSYIIKPLDFEKFLEIIKTIETFWLTLTELPKDD